MSAGPWARAFGAVLADARQARGLSQEALCELADFDRTYVSLVERGQREPKISSFVRLCGALQVSPLTALADTLARLSAAPCAAVPNVGLRATALAKVATKVVGSLTESPAPTVPLPRRARI